MDHVNALTYELVRICDAVHTRDLDKLNLVKVLGLRLEPISNSVPAATKILTFFKSGQR